MTSQETESAGNDFARYALLAAVCFVALLAGLTAWSVADRRASVEGFAKVSAVGDAPTFQARDKYNHTAPLVTFERRPLFPAEDAEADIRDSRMRRAGVVDGTEAIVYRCVDPEEGDAFYLKTGVDHYIRLKSEPERAR